MSTQLLDDELLNKLQLVNASKSKRFLNNILDMISILVLLIPIWFLIHSLYNIDFMDDSNGTTYNIIFYSLYFLYFFIAELSFKGKTIGKVFTKTRAIGKDGNVLTIKQAALRTLIRFVPFDTISIFNEANLTWHDRWVDTIVIDETLSNWEIDRIV